MKQKTKLKIIYITAFLIFLSGIIGSVILMQKPKSDIVEILSEEQVIYRLDLSREKDRTFTVEYNGGSNLIEISGGKIRVREADCRDNTCVKMGWLDSGAPVVCLPHRLVIRFAASECKIDAVAGQ